MIEKSLNETLKDLGYTTQINGLYRKDILLGRKIILNNATANDVWLWLKERSLDAARTN